MSEFVFTPGQKEEALSWYKENCLGLIAFLGPIPPFDMNVKESEILSNLLVDVYFKLKNSSFPIRKDEFIIGIEYKDAEKVKVGQEAVNIRFQNPHKKGQYDEIAHGVLINLLMSLKQ